jgi:hypothetical protein
MRWGGILIALVIGIGLVAGLTFYVQAIRPSLLFHQESEEIKKLLSQWREHSPPGVNEDRWRAAWYIAYNGFGNICFSPKHVSLEEIYRLKAEVQAKMREPATMASVRWFWNRLAETGPHGKQYIKQMAPLFNHAMEQPSPDQKEMP